jgi:hypothetical protein
VTTQDDGTEMAQQMRDRGMKGVLVTMAERGQILKLRCEMPHCYCPKGRDHFDDRSIPLSDWAANPDHYPRLKMDGGHLDPWNVRLAHVRCNRVDYGWRLKIKRMLEKKKSLQEIAVSLQKQGEPRPHGSQTWTPALVRKVYVS